jgi:hypothetical protein
VTLPAALAVLAIVLALRAVLNLQIAWAGLHGFARPSVLWSCLGLSLTLVPGMLIHEGGHWLAGIAVGQCCRRFVLGPIEIARSRGTWRIRFVGMHWRAGLVDFVPSNYAGFRRQRAIIAAAGPIASLVSGLLFVGFSRSAETALQFWLWSFCVQWAVVGFAQIIPTRLGTARSDGSLLWEVLRGGDAVDALQRDMLTASSHATTLRLRDWPEDLVRRLADAAGDNPAGRYGSYLAYIHFLDRGDVQTAAQHLDRLMAGWQPDDPPEYALEAAYFAAFHGHDAARAREWLALATRESEPWVRQRAEAAIECLDGSSQKAHALAGQALATLEASAPCGAYEYEIDLLEKLQAAAGSGDGGSSAVS